MRVCVVGGNGFIGSHVIDELRAATGYDLVVYDRKEETYRPRQPEVEYVVGELGNSARLVECLKGVDAVIHLASTITPKTSNEDMLLDVEQNVVGTLRLLDACVERQVKRIVFLSSGGTVYGFPQNLPITEQHPTDPICSYGIVKLTIEKYLALYRQLYGLDYRVLRPSNPYGERQNPLGEQGVISVFLWRVLHKQPLLVFGDGETVRDFLFITDLSRAIKMALEHRGPTRIFNVGGGQGLSINSLIETIAGLFDTSLVVENLPARPFDVTRVVLDTGPIRAEMNWQPEVALEQGLRRTWNWLSGLDRSALYRKDV
jgi:UDP-glucose 4-epimerase